MEPKISVIVPVYNRLSMLGRCLESILKTHYRNLEILVIDDGSYDGSLELAESFKKDQSDIIRVLIHPEHKNLGVSASRNLGIKSATGDYVCFLDSDDIMLSDRFEYGPKILNTYQEVDGVYEAYELFYENNEKRTIQELGEDASFDDLGTCEFNPRYLIFTGAILVRSNLFARCGLFDENMWVGEDLHMWYRMYAIGRLVPGRKDKPVVKYYKHIENTYGFDADIVNLKIFAYVYKWACKRKVGKNKLMYLKNNYFGRLFYYLTQNRNNKLGSRREALMMLNAFLHFPNCIFNRLFLANVFHLIKNISQY